MLSQKNRLKQKERPIAKGAQKFFLPDLSLVYAQNSHEGQKTKFLIVVPAKVIGNATKRNLLKRRVRHIIKQNENLWKNEGVYSFYFKKGVADKAFQGIEKDIVALLGKVK